MLEVKPRVIFDEPPKITGRRISAEEIEAHMNNLPLQVKMFRALILQTNWGLPRKDENGVYYVKGLNGQIVMDHFNEIGNPTTPEQLEEKVITREASLHEIWMYEVDQELLPNCRRYKPPTALPTDQ